MNKFLLEHSDLITYHDYRDLANHQQAVDTLKRYGRPMLCTEYMARQFNSTFQEIMPMLKAEQVGAFNWGFVAGKTNTIFKWGEPLPDVDEPPLWFHDILRKDGTPFSQAEINVIKQLTKPGITMEPFGTYNGQSVESYTLTNNNGVMMKVITYGGIITELHVPDKNGTMGDVVLGFDQLENYISPEYKRNNPYFGAIIGRYCTRIAKGKFTLDGVEYKLNTNDGENHLHGGNIGFNAVIWNTKPVESVNGYALELTYTSKDMEEGYPGNLQVTVTYTLTDANELKIDYRAVTDKATPCNLTNHSYFNLSGGKRSDIKDHFLVIIADRFAEMTNTLVTTGRLIDVAGTPMDFTTPRKIGERIDADYGQLKPGRGYAHSWNLRNNAGSLALATTLYEPESGRFMEVLTTEPAMHFYAGTYLDGTLTGKNNIRYVKCAGLCLETQHLPDPNQPAFPSTILKPGQIYKSQTIFRFSVKK